MREQPIRIRLLGTAAGGGLPQWNCACANCKAAREGKIPSRTQSGIAINPGVGTWILINASPDLRAQIEAFPGLQPRGSSARNSPVSNIFLTNADLDHVLGLLLLRERGERFCVHCTAAVRETLRSTLQIDALLARYCGIEWFDLPGTMTPLEIQGKSTGLMFRAISLPGTPPRYTTQAQPSTGQSVALEFADSQGGPRLLLAPDVAAIIPELRFAMDAADAVIFDGTFWSADELQQVDPSARTALEMGHLPVSGGSLEVLRGLRARRRVYTHINNTNPILQPGSPERLEVEKAGVIVGEDGMEFEL